MPSHSDPPETDWITDRSAIGSTGRRSILKGALGIGGSSTLAGCFGGGGDQETLDAATATASRIADSDSPTTTGTTTQTQSGPSDNVIVVPPGGDINAALQGVKGGAQWAENPYGGVRLQAGENYEIEETIVMPGGTILDCNGARMVPVENVDVINMSAGSHVKQPYIDARSNKDWNSTLIKVTSRLRSIGAIDPVRIENMLLFAPLQQGTGIKIIDSNGVGLWAAVMSGVIHKPEIGIHLRAEGKDSWVNTCQFNGKLRANRIGILMEEEGETLGMDGHWMNILYQTHEEKTEWVWDIQSGDRARIDAGIWDVHGVVDETVWRIGQDSGHNNHLVDTFGKYRWEDNVVENKIGDGPNGAAGNTLFNFAEAQAHLDMQRRLDGVESEVAELKEQVGGE